MRRGRTCRRRRFVVDFAAFLFLENAQIPFPAMKLPVSWLAEFVDISDLSERELADRITFAGIEIEGIEKVGADFTGICAALVDSSAPPNENG